MTFQKFGNLVRRETNGYLTIFIWHLGRYLNLCEAQGQRFKCMTTFSCVNKEKQFR